MYNNANRHCHCLRENSISSLAKHTTHTKRWGSLKLKSALVVVISAIGFMVLIPSPCLGQNSTSSQNRSLSQRQGRARLDDDFDGVYVDTSNQNKTRSAPWIRNKHSPNCNTYFYIGDKNASLPCIGMGEPKPTMRWKLLKGNNRTFSRNLGGQNWTRFQGVNDEYINCTLRFPPIEKRFEGVYLCIAENENGTAYLEFNVKILDPDTFWHGKPGIFIAFLTILVLAAGIINTIVKHKCCQPKPKVRLSAEYKKGGNTKDGFEEVRLVAPDSPKTGAEHPA